MADYRIARIIVLLAIFTAVEVLTLFYWLVFGNSKLGVEVLIVGLTIEHAISLVTGYMLGVYFPGKAAGPSRIVRVSTTSSEGLITFSPSSSFKNLASFNASDSARKPLIMT